MSDLLAALPAVKQVHLGPWYLYDLMRAAGTRVGWNRARAEYVKVNSLLRVFRSGKVELYRQHSAGFSRVPESSIDAALAPLVPVAVQEPDAKPTKKPPTGVKANAEKQARGRQKGEGRRANGRSTRT